MDDSKPLLPGFTEDGMLPPGEYELTFDEVRESVLVTGPGEGYESWDASWRLKLVEQAEILVMQLWDVGIQEVFLNGSFVEDKDHPNDIDGYFVTDLRLLASGELEHELNLRDPFKVWTWDPLARRPYPGYPKKQLPMWHQYRVELYPHYEGLSSGICDQFGNALEFPAAFRLSRRADKVKGILKMKPD